MEKSKTIWCIIATSRVKGTKDEFKNPMVLCAYKTLKEALQRRKRLELLDEFLEWKYELESTELHETKEPEE